MKHRDKVLREIMSNDTHLIFYTDGIASLEKSKIFDYLRAASVTELYAAGANIHITAAQGAFSAGYNKALDDIMDFKEFILDKSLPKKEVPKADYGGIDLAVENKHISKDEADAIKSGFYPRYDPATGKLKPPTL